MATGGPVVPLQCVTKVELTISCENLLDMDVFSKSDPLCALYIESGTGWYEVCSCSSALVLTLQNMDNLYDCNH